MDEREMFEAWWHANETWPVKVENIAFLAWQAARRTTPDREAIHQVREKGSLKWQDIEPISLSMFADEERYVQRIVYTSPQPMQPDWRDLTRRLYVELFYCDQQMTGGPRPKWTQGAEVRDVLRDAKAALEAAPTSDKGGA